MIETDVSPGPQPPGGVYLCQVNDQVSCGACCGLYNVEYPSHAALESMLADRTDSFRRIPREADAITEFGKVILRRQVGNPSLPDFHHCPFLGLIGREKSRVGCLLHPLATGNHGVDFRGLSHYGGMACRVYFCPTHQKLSREIKMVVRETAESWYDYGLVITEAKLLTAFFAALEKRIDAAVDTENILQNRECRHLLRKVSQLKIDWPFRRRIDSGLCHYMFDDSLYRKNDPTYPPESKKVSRFDAIFRELGSGFKTDMDLASGEGIVGGMINELASQIDKGNLFHMVGPR
jgi:hypothetical protein